MDMTRFVVDESWRRDGVVVFAGSPLSRFTFSGTKFVEQVESGTELRAGNDELIERLLDAGAIHPLPGPHPFHPSDVTVVIPAHIVTAVDRDALSALVAALPRDTPVIVVDDASPLAFIVPDTARVIRQHTQRGPAAARNAGLREVTTSFAAFIDSDVKPPTDLLDNLLPYFVDEQVGLVAPRIVSRPSSGLIARYECQRSPLDFGPTEGRVRAGTRISYVPSATWVCRTEAIRAIDGFDESMITGEDVDAVWRLDLAGWRCRYQPDVSCEHAPRATLTAMLSQRMGYGRSAAGLAAKHGSRVAPARTTAAVAGAWTVGALLSPLLGIVIAAIDAMRLSKTLRSTAPAEIARLSLRAHRHAGAMFAAAITRTWWPLALVAALFSRRARRTLIAAAVIPAALEWRQRHASIDPVRFLVIRILDDAAYGIGVWQGVRRHRRTAAIRPSITRR